ncbi:MAG: carboxypeptidase-like regulatory domain-containing protein [Vicinamibacterales bacterium]
MKMSLLACAIIVTIALPVQARVQTRDARTAGAAPSATPSGRAELTVVVSTDEPSTQPLRRVSVAIQAGEIDIPRIGVTDDAGRVVFRELTAGNYRIVASRPGYVRTFYGSLLAGRGPGVAVSVVEGQRNPEVRIRMLRGSVLTGIVRDSSGRPAPNQQVQALMVRTAGGEKRAVNLDAGIGSVITDDRGAYRIFGLAPGDYIVSLPLIGLTGQQVRQMTTAELAWADKVAASTARPSTAPAIAAPPEGPSVSYAPVYYPGTTVAAEAGVLTIGPSEERGGVDLALAVVPTAQIRGRVVDGENRPQSDVTVQVRPTQPDALDLYSSLLMRPARTQTDGTFTIQGVTPGAYTLTVRATPRGDTASAAGPPNPAEAMRQAFALMGGGSGSHWAAEDIVVEGRDLSDVTLMLRPGMTIAGRIVYEATTKAPPTDMTRAGLTLISATASETTTAASALLGAGAADVKIAADGTFTITGIAPGSYRLNTPLGMMSSALAPGFGAAAGGWTLKSALVNGRDISDAPIDMRSGTDVAGVVVTFTDRPSELSGTVLDSADRPTPGFPIVVFSTDRAYWTQGSRRVQQVRPASNGTFVVTGLPAGEYYVCAVTAVERTDLYDPAFLDQLAPASLKLTIADGEKKKQDLKLGTGP